jgi:hypothetical protein
LQEGLKLTIEDFRERVSSTWKTSHLVLI